MKPIRSNPIFKRINRRVPTGIYFISDIYFAISALILLYVNLRLLYWYVNDRIRSGSPDENLSTFLYFMFLVAVLIFPLGISLFAANLSAQDTNTDLYKLMCLTSMTNLAIVKGYLFTVLHRIRFLMLLVVGLIPNLVFVELALRINVINCNMGSLIPCANQPSVPITIDWLIWTLLLVEALIGLVGLNLLGAAIGVFWGFLWRKQVLAVITTFISIIVVLYLLGSIFFTLFLADNPFMMSKTIGHGWFITLYMAVPYLAAGFLIYLTTRLARKIQWG